MTQREPEHSWTMPTTQKPVEGMTLSTEIHRAQLVNRSLGLPVTQRQLAKWVQRARQLEWPEEARDET